VSYFAASQAITCSDVRLPVQRLTRHSSFCPLLRCLLHASAAVPQAVVEVLEAQPDTLPGPVCPAYEVRLGHSGLLELCLSHVLGMDGSRLPRDARLGALQMMSTAAVASPVHATARSQRWPPIRRVLRTLSSCCPSVSMCVCLSVCPVSRPRVDREPEGPAVFATMHPDSPSTQPSMPLW
jgi:hypothetical protein